MGGGKERGRHGQNERQIKINSVWKCFHVAPTAEEIRKSLDTRPKRSSWENPSPATEISTHISTFRCRINKYAENSAFATFIESLNELNEFGLLFIFKL